MRAPLLGLLALLAAGACAQHERPPEGQILLYVTTDAVLPAPDAVEGGYGLFDRLSIEIFPPGELAPCVGCARQFELDARRVDEGRASMGYVPRPGVPGSRARVRLFRTLGAEVVEARATSTLETVVALPVVAADGIVEVTAVLETASLGSPVGTLDEPVAPVIGAPSAGRVGTWEAARRRPCSGAARPGEVCVNGGAFWIGKPTAALSDQKNGLEHLAVVSPFFMDASEVTVKALRDAGTSSAHDPGRFLLDDAECTFTDAPGTHEALPVNCLSRPAAMEYCAKRGARLPTEAEFEWVATAFGRFETYPWGREPPRCNDAIFGRSVAATTVTTSEACAPATGTAAVGTSTRDRLAVLDRGEIVDLVGNVSEWVDDDYDDESGPCWAPPILLDPRCRTRDHVGTGRGGFWAAPVNLVDAKVRFRFDGAPDKRPYFMGVRCVRDVDR